MTPSSCGQPARESPPIASAQACSLRLRTRRTGAGTPDSQSQLPCLAPWALVPGTRFIAQAVPEPASVRFYLVPHHGTGYGLSMLDLRRGDLIVVRDALGSELQR